MTGKEARQKLDVLIQAIEIKKTELDNLLLNAQKSFSELDSILSNTKSRNSDTSLIQGQINEKHAKVTQILTEITGHNTQAKLLVEVITTLQKVAAEQNGVISELATKTKDLVGRNSELADKVSDLLQKAAAGRLFQSFNIRKIEHTAGSRFWMWMVLGSAVILTTMAFGLAWMVHTKGIVSYEFLIKLSVSFPIIYWLVFSTRQYTKAKRLEEEYAFKSAISLSLEAYRDLIKRESGETTKAEVIPFITDAVNKIFSSPSQAIAEQPHKEDTDVAESLIDKVLKLANKFRP